jgi:diguanylate cyclase (GGDEF)-like protein/PAS domain S-box-containing protein
VTVVPALPRPKRSRRWQDFVLAVMALLLMAAAYTSVLIVQRQTTLATMSRYNLTWLVSQAGLEVSRLRGTIASSLIPGSDVDHDELDLRLAIVENRVELMSDGDLAEFIASSRELDQIVTSFRRAIRQAREELDHATSPDQYRKLLKLIEGQITPIAHLTAAANAFSGDMEAQDRRDLNYLHWLFAAILFATTLCGLALVAAVSWRNRLLARTQQQVRQQNAALQERDGELEVRNQRFDAALNNMPQALCMADAGGRLVVCNARFVSLFGLHPGDIEFGRDISEVFQSAVSRGSCQSSLINSIQTKQAHFAREGVSGTFTVEDATGCALAVFQEPMPDGGWVATFEDITERRRTEARINHIAHHDGLTGLPNRVQFHSKLHDALKGFELSGVSVAVLCLDLDRFKQVNDVYGHPFGDQLLKIVGARLSRCVRECDVVARLGGDEFAILQAGAAQPRSAETTALRVIQDLSAPYDINGQHVVIGASVGIGIAAEPSVDADILLKNADIALYRAKSEGRGTHCFYHAEMGIQLRRRRDMEDDLRAAQERMEFRAYYQPLYALALDRVCGFEALIRWEHPERGLVLPAEFIPIAEETGLIGSIGEWILRQACADAATWPADTKVAVNLSSIQFGDPQLVSVVENVLQSTCLKPGRLELEITESLLLQNSPSVMSMLGDLRKLGVRLVLDDFGTGYSSLSYLQAFPFDKVKIDRSFVQQMSPQSNCEAIVKAIVNLATCLGMTTTAEGIETKEQLEQLRHIGCTEVQGYLIDRPRPVVAVNRWLGTAHSPLTPGYSFSKAAVSSPDLMLFATSEHTIAKSPADPG